MPADVADRFKEYQKISSFNGHMSTWNTKYFGQTIQTLNTTITDPDDWTKVYRSCQRAMQAMYENKNHSVGIGSDYNPATKGFIDKWCGPNSYKTFPLSTARTSPPNNVKATFNHLHAFLSAHTRELKPIFTKQISDVFGDTTYEKFLSDLQSGEYDKNPDFRKKVKSVIDYIQWKGPKEGSPEAPDVSDWPPNVGYNMAGAPAAVAVTDPALQDILGISANPLPSDQNDWYQVKDEAAHVDRFKVEYTKFFDELLTSGTFRSKFLEMADDPIKKALETAIKDTDYENKESDDFVPAKLEDSKHWDQKLKKWAKDTYENHLRRFTNPSRGTRLFFSPHSQNIMKAFDKAGIKPTDGLEGILAKKDNAKLRNVVNDDPQTKKHFDWFVKKMEELKAETPDDFEGALRDGDHLQRLVINLIIKASKECEYDKGAQNKAMTALEVLSVAKYGLLCSRTLDRLNEATKDLKILSDDKLLGNKNKGIQFVTKAADQTLKLAIRGAGLMATGIRNFIQHRKTKIGKDIGKYENLNAAYKNWQTEDNKRHTDLINGNVANRVTETLTELNNPARVIGAPGTSYKTTVQINDETLENVKTNLENARTAGVAVVAPYGCNIDDLQNDIELYESATERQKHADKWRDENPDVIHNLVAYWDMLESVGKTHAFTLGSMKVKRDAMLKDFNFKNKTSIAQQQAWDYIGQYGDLRTAA